MDKCEENNGEIFVWNICKKIKLEVTANDPKLADRTANTTDCTRGTKATGDEQVEDKNNHIFKPYHIGDKKWKDETKWIPINFKMSFDWKVNSMLLYTT